MTMWIKFLALLLPDAKALLRDLYHYYGGDVGKARVALRRIRDHGARLDDEEERIDARLDAVRAAEDAELVETTKKG